MYNWNKIIATFFYSGCTSKAPGTVGSLAALPFIFIVNQMILKVYSFNNFVSVEDFFQYLGVHFILCLILFIIGTIVSGNYAKSVGKDDPKEVVIDEVVGMWLVLIICSPGAMAIMEQVGSFSLLCVLFLLFRLFDAVKPWPISWFDRNIKGGIGIMLDDVIAALLASLSFYCLWFILADFWKS